MARAMPAFATKFSKTVDRAVAIARAGELIRANSEQGDVGYSQLPVARLEALYELAYLRIFLGWEIFLEETFLRMMCGYESQQYVPTLAAGKTSQGRLRDAKLALYGGRDFLLWHNPGAIERRAHEWFDNGVHEQVIQSNQARLQWLASVRHRIAHGSEDARKKMNEASMGLAGRRYPAASAGRFLRDWTRTDPLFQERRLVSVATELAGMARQIAP
jgi:hypothetical protein